MISSVYQTRSNLISSVYQTRSNIMWDFTQHKQYKFRGFCIPVRMMDELERYIEHHMPPGDFLSAVLKNDLRAAVDRADDKNLTNLPAYIEFLYYQAPASCWGSPKAFSAWVNNEK